MINCDLSSISPRFQDMMPQNIKFSRTLVWRPARGDPVELRRQTYHAETEALSHILEETM